MGAGAARARGGSDFQKPKNTGAGKYRGVEVRDFGATRMAEPSWNAIPPTTHVAGSPVWIDHGDGLHFDREELVYHAIVDARFHVRTYSRELLTAALARTGRLREIVRPFDALALVPEDADHIVCLLPRAQDGPYWNRPLPVEPTVVARRASSKRVLLLHRLPMTKEFAAMWGATVASRRVGAWTIDEMDGAAVDDMRRQLWFATLFGIAILA